jgi:oligopeptide transport system substrate-binding protein
MLIVVMNATMLAADPAGDGFVFNNINEPGTLDPSVAPGDAEYNVVRALFEGLVGNDPRTGLPVPALARSWTVAPDGMSMTFYLRPASFSDGVPITARVVRDSWLRTLAPETAGEYAYLVNLVVAGAEAYNGGKTGADKVALEVLDDSTLRVGLVRPLPYALDIMTSMPFYVLPMHTISKFGSDWSRPGNLVSSGPFLLKEWVKGDRIVVEANPRYWDSGKVGLSRITYKFVADLNVAWRMYRSGELDSTLAPPDLLPELRLLPSYRPTAALITQYIFPNCSHPPLDDPRVRRALSLAIDRDALVRTVLGGGGKPAWSLVPELPRYPNLGGRRDVETARRLLAEAGYRDGKGFPKTTLQLPAATISKRVAEFLQSEWRSTLGVEIDLRAVELKVLLDFRDKGLYDLSLGGWGADYPDPTSFLDIFAESGKAKVGLYSDPDYHRTLDEAATLQDGPARSDLLRKAEIILIERDQGVIPLYYPIMPRFLDPMAWEGWYPNPLGANPWKSLRKK